FLLLIEQRRWPLVRVRRHWFGRRVRADRKSTRLNSSHVAISYAVFCLNKKKRRRRMGTFRGGDHWDLVSLPSIMVGHLAPSSDISKVKVYAVVFFFIIGDPPETYLFPLLAFLPI